MVIFEFKLVYYLSISVFCSFFHRIPHTGDLSDRNLLSGLKGTNRWY